VVLAAAGAVAAVLAAGAGVSTWQMVRAQDAETATAAQLGLTKAAEAKAVERENAEREAKEDEKRAMETAEAVSTFMQEVFAQGSAAGQASKTRGVKRDLTVKEAMDHAAKAIAGRFPGRPDIEAAVRASVGVTYLQLAAYPEAERQLKQALDLRQKALGPDHPDTLGSVSNPAILYQGKGDYPAAEPLYKRALAGYEKAHGPDHPGTLSIVNNLAVLYSDKGDYPVAEPLYRRALAGYERALGPDHPDTLLSIDNLAALYFGAKRFGEAAPLFEKVYRGYLKRPEGASSALESRADLGLALLGAGKAADAEPHLLAGYDGLMERMASNPMNCNRLRYTAQGLVELYGSTDRPADATAWRAKLAALPPEVAPRPRPAK
jgi:tetratricopeptide (TPR) repeat protein